MVNNVREVLEALGYTHITEYAKEFRVAPMYRESNNNSVLVIRKDSGRWIDYAMGETGNLADLVQLSLELPSLDEAKSWLSGKKLVVRNASRTKELVHKTVEIFDKTSLARLVFDTSYWQKRGISERTLRLFGGGVAYKGKLAGRYVFPIYNGRNDLVGFAGRDIFNNSTRVKWKLLGSKDKWVYPASLNFQNIKTDKYVILVESIGDCLALFDAGIVHVLVTFGITLGSGILNFLIKRDVRNIIISLNNDAVSGAQWGNSAANKIQKKFLSYFDESQIHVVLPDKKDFGEMTKDELNTWKTQKLYPLVASKQ